MGTPTQIYDRRNIFVAGFISNPAMNLINGGYQGQFFCGEH